MMTKELKLFGGFVILALLFLLGYFVDACVLRGRSFMEAFILVTYPVPGFPDVLVRPITLLQLTFFLFAAVLVEWEPVRLLLSLPIPRILVAAVALASAYETLWNFAAWFAHWILEGGLFDTLPNRPLTFLGMPTNFTAATKVSTLFTASCLYALWRASSVENPPRTTAEYVAFLKLEIAKLKGRKRKGK